MASSYRPHNSGHDYYEAGAYLITLVVGERERILSVLNKGGDLRILRRGYLPTITHGIGMRKRDLPAGLAP